MQSPTIANFRGAFHGAIAGLYRGENTAKRLIRIR
jgi:hypothetical protein